MRRHLSAISSFPRWRDHRDLAELPGRGEPPFQVDAPMTVMGHTQQGGQASDRDSNSGPGRHGDNSGHTYPGAPRQWPASA